MFQDKALLIALGISAAIHLSTISVFSIGVWFPVEQRVYHKFDIREEGTLRVRVSGDMDLPSFDEYLSGVPKGDIVVPSLRDRIADTIEIQAPRMDFGGLERGQLRREAVASTRRLEVADNAPQLSTIERVGERIGGLASGLRDLRPFREDDEDSEEPEEEVGPVALDEPAPGFEAHIDWFIGDRKRQTLLPLSIPALSRVDPAEWTVPVSLVIKVDPSGRVIEALTPPSESSPIMTDIGLAVLQTRFRSLPDGDNSVHTGAIIIRAKEEVE